MYIRCTHYRDKSIKKNSKLQRANKMAASDGKIAMHCFDHTTSTFPSSPHWFREKQLTRCCFHQAGNHVQLLDAGDVCRGAHSFRSWSFLTAAIPRRRAARPRAAKGLVHLPRRDTARVAEPPLGRLLGGGLDDAAEPLLEAQRRELGRPAGTGVELGIFARQQRGHSRPPPHSRPSSVAADDDDVNSVDPVLLDELFHVRPSELPLVLRSVAGAAAGRVRCLKSSPARTSPRRPLDKPPAATTTNLRQHRRPPAQRSDGKWRGGRWILDWVGAVWGWGVGMKG